eukprot:Em0001g1237a
MLLCKAVEVEKTEEDEDGNTDDLYERIHQLSEKIKNELTFHGQSTGCDAQTRVEAEIAAVVDQSSPSKNVDVDERLQKAIEKMAKLDTKLLELVKKEKEVKKQTKKLQQRMLEGGNTSDDIVLCLGDDDMDPMLPVFATQPQDRDTVQKASKATIGAEGATASMLECSTSTDELNEATHHIVDYVKRNIEVSGEAGGVFAMTNTEKQRLEELMAGEDDDDPEKLDSAVVLASDTGYQYTEHDLLRMKEIDSRLQALLPPADWEAICFTPASSTYPSIIRENSKQSLDMLFEDRDLQQPLQAQQDCILSREECERLHDIDGKLIAVQDSINSLDTCMQPTLSPSALQELLNQCMKELHPENVVISAAEPTISSGDN